MCHKCKFEINIKNIYGMKILNDMNHIHENEVNNISECNLLHGVLDPSKLTKNINIYHSPILRVCMNTCRGKAKFKNFRILLVSGFSSTIVMRSLLDKLKAKKGGVVKWHTQADNLTTNMRVGIDFTLPEFIVSKIVTW